MDHDTFHRTSPGTLVDWRDRTTARYSGLAALRAARGLEEHGQESTGRADPFVDAAAGDYRVRGTSPAHGSGAPLPRDVAAAIGVLAGRPVDPGALVQPARRVTGAGRTRERLTTGS